MTVLDSPDPPAPDASNDNALAKQQQGPQGAPGLFVPMQQLMNLAKMWVNFRPIIGFGARMAKVKIPKEIDDALTALASTGDPAALAKLQEAEQQGTQGWQPPPLGGEVPENEPGAPVLPHDLAEEAYYLHTYKNMGVRDIALEFTNRGNPVSKATVARYIDDIAQEIEEQQGARWKKVATYGTLVMAWAGSAFALDLVLHLFHVL